MSTFEACHRFVTTRAFHGVLNKANTSTTVNAPIFSEVEVPLSTEMFSFCSGVCSGHRHLHLWPLTFPLHSNRAWDPKTDALSFSLSRSPFSVAFQAQPPAPLIPHLLPLTFFPQVFHGHPPQITKNSISGCVELCFGAPMGLHA